jgi:group I intron endonuclease
MDTYKATNTTNGKFYIGSTTNFDRRKAEHLKCKENYPFQNALRKNPEDFEWEVWSDDSDEPILEQALLDMWFGKECCYNLNPSAKHPPSQKGKSPSPERRAKTSATLMGHPVSEDTRKKMSVAGKSRTLCEAFLRNQKADKQGGKNPAAKAIILIHPDGTEEVFDSMAEACRKYGLDDSHLSSCAKGKRKRHRGYTARYRG